MRIWISRFVFSLVLLQLLRPIAAQETQEYADPWTLRKHYTINLRDASMDYDETNAELRGISHGKVFLSSNTFSIVLGDGSTLTPAELGEGDSTRETIASPYGDGSHYTVTFPPHKGLQVVHRVTRFKQQPFLLLELSVTNTGAEPLTLREINPLVIGAGGLQLEGEARLTTLPLGTHGGFTMYDPASAPLFAFLSDTGNRTGFAMGMLPRGRARAGVELQQQGDAWQGRAMNVFEPGLRVAPGERVAADTLWLSYALPTLEEVTLYYAWTHSTRPQQTTGRVLPKGWITVDEGKGAAELAALAQAAQSAGLKFALLPRGYENRPGGAARQLRDAKLVAGITVDPMLFDGGQPAWSAAADGQSWLNLNHEAAQALVGEKIRALHKNGFDFFVVAKSAIPDAVLENFGLARAAADALALEAVMAAAGPAPVFPAPLATIGAGDTRLEADQRALAQFTAYKAPFGPVRISFDRGQVSQATLNALKDWPGPIELLGAPPQGARAALRPLFQQGP